MAILKTSAYVVQISLPNVQHVGSTVASAFSSSGLVLLDLATGSSVSLLSVCRRSFVSSSSCSGPPIGHTATSNSLCGRSGCLAAADHDDSLARSKDLLQENTRVLSQHTAMLRQQVLYHAHYSPPAGVDSLWRLHQTSPASHSQQLASIKLGQTGSSCGTQHVSSYSTCRASANAAHVGGRGGRNMRSGGQQHRSNDGDEEGQPQQHRRSIQRSITRCKSLTQVRVRPSCSV